MSNLLAKAVTGAGSSLVQKITPERAGWQYVDFEVHRLAEGNNIELFTDSQELCVVLVSGFADVSCNDDVWKNIGRRSSPFEPIAPFSVYCPPNSKVAIEALSSELEVALCMAPATGALAPKLITPEQCTIEERGEGSNRRTVCNILFTEGDAERLLITEVLTPGGNWSSYPPHKHDSDLIPEESQLEETYYHRVKPSQGFAFQRVYTDDRSIDETMTVEDGDVVMVPKGYHPVGAPHGYDLYYLNVMAGPRRKWIFKNDPQHEWIIDNK